MQTNTIPTEPETVQSPAVSPTELGASACSSWLTNDEKERVEEIANRGAANVETKPEHWIHGWDEALSFCRDCAEAKIKELIQSEPDAEYCLDGGWGIDGDGLEFCETCGDRLWNSLTAYGCESEVEHFIENGFDPQSDDDCYSLERVISSNGWGPYADLPGSDFEKRTRHDYYSSLNSLGRRILAQVKTNAGPLATPPPTP